MFSGIQSALQNPPEVCASYSKVRTFYPIARNFLTRIAKSVVLNRKEYKTMYYSDIAQQQASDKLTIAHTGIGTSNTWHGHPDARLRGSENEGKKMCQVYSQDYRTHPMVGQ